MAPEREFPFACDMYALGVTVHEAALGTTPKDTNPRQNWFGGRRGAKVDRAGNKWHLEGPSKRSLSLRPVFSPELDQVTHHLLYHRPEMRWTARKLVEIMRTQHIERLVEATSRPLAPWSYNIY